MLLDISSDRLRFHIDSTRKFVSLRDDCYLVLFDSTPKIDESVSVNYQQKALPQLPTSINYYESTSTRTYNVSNILFVSRTREEATENQRTINLLRAWTKPAFGSTDMTGMNKYSMQLSATLGMPPPILIFSAYQNNKTYIEGSVSDPIFTSGGIKDVPVVITAFSVDWPEDIDYIPAIDLSPVPIIQTVSLTLLETHTPANISKFNVNRFLNGNLLNY